MASRLPLIFIVISSADFAGFGNTSTVQVDAKTSETGGLGIFGHFNVKSGGLPKIFNCYSLLASLVWVKT